MEDRTYELGNEKIGRLLMRYSAPAMVAMLANATYNLVDTVFVQHAALTPTLARGAHVGGIL